MQIKNLTLVLFSIILLLLFIELSLRAIGIKPRSINSITINEPKTNNPDKILGWIPKEGIHEFKPWSDNGKITKLTINNDGSRKTGEISENNKKIIFIGGSITQGWAVDDNETFTSLIQKKNYNYKIKNYGVGGYGGYQSLLFLKRILNNNNDIKLIIYGFIPHHEFRNIAAGSWIYLLNQFSSRGIVSIPYASLDKDNNLINNTPISYLNLPFGKKSSLISKVEKRIMKIKSLSREKSKFEISKKIILEMKKISKDKDIDFKLLSLDEMSVDKFNNYKKFLSTNNIDLINCNIPRGENYVVKNEGHPNLYAHKIVSSCLYKKLDILKNN
jgi:hypothetical protein